MRDRAVIQLVSDGVVVGIEDKLVKCLFKSMLRRHDLYDIELGTSLVASTGMYDDQMSE